MYRASALKMLNLKIDIKNDVSGVINAIADTKIEISHIGDEQHIYLDGSDVTNLIRTPEVSMGCVKHCGYKGSPFKTCGFTARNCEKSQLYYGRARHRNICSARCGY